MSTADPTSTPGSASASTAEPLPEPRAETPLPPDVTPLRAQVAGPVLVAGDADLPTEVAGFNLAIVHTPAVVVGATCADDVVAAVRFATEQRLPVAVQATGHGPVRPAAGALLVTTKRMQGVQVDAARRSARVEAGVRWADVLAAAAEHGLAGLCGSSPTVGVVGYTLGGGMGMLGRAHGFAADHVTAVELVTADGTLRRVTADEESADDRELFWGVRGGKGNFGIVTALEFDLFEVPTLYGGGIFFSADSTAGVLHAWRAWAPTLPPEAATSIALLRVPPMEEMPEPIRGECVAHLRFAHPGPAEEAAALLAPMQAAGEIVMANIDTMPFPVAAVMVHMDPQDPIPAWERGGLLTDLTEQTVDALLGTVGPDVDIPLIMAEVRLLGGALGREPEVPDAVAGRDAAYSVFLVAPGVPELTQVLPAIADGVYAALEPWRAPGGLVNFLGDHHSTEQVGAAWAPEVHERLMVLKRRVDPDDVFCFGYALGT